MQPHTYSLMLNSLLSGTVPQAYTTIAIKTEMQLEENLMGVLRARTQKGSPMPIEHSPVNWYTAPLSINEYPFRYPWSQDALRKIIKSSLHASAHVDPFYNFKLISITNRYWEDPLGWARALPVARVPEGLRHQLQHMDTAQNHS